MASRSQNQNDSSDEELNTKLNGVTIRTLCIGEENTEGKWLPSHPWRSKNKPDPGLKMPDKINISSKHPISLDWAIEGSGKKKFLNLKKILSNLPEVVECEMKGSINGSRRELEHFVHGNNSNFSNPLPKNPSDMLPHTREIFDRIEGNGGIDRPSLPRDRHLKATSLETYNFTPRSRRLKEKNIFYFHCEHTLKMHVPGHLSTWFNTQQREETQWIKGIARHNKRWIFIPSFRREKIALLYWPEDKTVNKESTIRILVVRPSEFNEYVRYCGHLFSVICLPQDEIGVGYPRLWIQKIAQRLELQFIWMIDDSVECFYEYHPDQEPLERQVGENKSVRNYTDYRRRQFGLVFKRIEDFVKEADDDEKPIAAMSPRRWNPICRPKKPFSCMPPQGAVYLNLRALLEKNVHYRPELKTLEDMIFGYECEQKGLKVYRDNRVLLQDHNWKDTGASSPSVVKAVESTASTELVEEIETKSLNDECVLL